MIEGEDLFWETPTLNIFYNRRNTHCLITSLYSAILFQTYDVSPPIKDSFI